jgi:hypothetical protein
MLELASLKAKIDWAKIRSEKFSDRSPQRGMCYCGHFYLKKNGP